MCALRAATDGAAIRQGRLGGLAQCRAGARVRREFDFARRGPAAAVDRIDECSAGHQSQRTGVTPDLGLRRSGLVVFANDNQRASGVCATSSHVERRQHGGSDALSVLQRDGLSRYGDSMEVPISMVRRGLRNTGLDDIERHVRRISCGRNFIHVGARPHCRHEQTDIESFRLGDRADWLGCSRHIFEPGVFIGIRLPDPSLPQPRICATLSNRI